MFSGFALFIYSIAGNDAAFVRGIDAGVLPLGAVIALIIPGIVVICFGVMVTTLGFIGEATLRMETSMKALEGQVYSQATISTNLKKETKPQMKEASEPVMKNSETVFFGKTISVRDGNTFVGEKQFARKKDAQDAIQRGEV
jgi:hypothetical protein